MTTKQILFSIIILGTIYNVGLTMDTNEPSSLPKKAADNPTTYYISPNRIAACTVTEEYIIYMEKVKKDKNGSCISSGPLMLSEINTALENQLQKPMTPEEFWSVDYMVKKMTTSDCNCNSILVRMAKKENSDRLYDLFKQAEKHIILQ